MTALDGMDSSALTTLDVRVTDKADGNALYLYLLRSAEGTARAPLEQEHSVEVHQELVRMLSSRMEEVLRKKQDTGSSHRSELATVCRTLYQALFPQMTGNVPDLVTKLHESSGPLLVRTNEMTVPWELLFVENEFLGLTREIGRRWVVQRRVAGGRRINGIRRALIVGDPLGDLPDAAREAEKVAEWMREKGTECKVLLREEANLINVVMELSEQRYDLFHFCGHVASAASGTSTGLVLHDRQLLDERALRFEVPPVIFVNGCKSAGRAANICASFMVMGAQAVVGTRTGVGEEKARHFAEEFYRGLTTMTTGAAMRAAQLKLSADDDDLTWASFMLYGDPTVRISGDSEPHGEPPSPSQGHDEQLEFDDEATGVLARAVEAAQGRRLITSVHLLLGLIGSVDLRPQITASIGAERLAQITERLTAAAAVGRPAGPKEDTGTGSDGDPEDEPEYADPIPSDTVTQVFFLADQLASAEGHSNVSVHDLAAALLEVGAGTSAREVERCGVPVERLLRPEPSTTGTDLGTSRQILGLADGGGPIRTERLDPVVARAIRIAHSLSAPRGKVIGTYMLLLAFGLAGSPVLREALATQGERGQRALGLLFAEADPPGTGFSKRTLAALGTAGAADPDRPLGEAAVLRALIDHNSTARSLLKALGVEPDAVSRNLRPPD
ncbi:CHAT domain-containing protein [Actinomadura sp. KC216]|uniref:CHAT domain-containing protein n=1 Tax=Actinomadura sp. KC216 TaxID=2530370 RepID=UPI0010478B46|nr:CHAT domain-containing protein [Actinomadura sp. KC216]TDB91398.1 CHAT domain-containing protein [Actinomadura sp. KC216]